jgi:L-ascorbate metabolism protein UlaG (beta-lactamase superfamily)
MVIQWLGQACFKITSGDLVIVIDPYSKETGLTPPRFRADIVLVTHAHFDHSNHESLTGRSPADERASPRSTEEPFLISGPGEYETKGVYIGGIETYHDNQNGTERGMNTMYKLEVEGLRILHMGDFGEEKLRDETLEKIGDVNILMIPVGGKYTIDGSAAAKIIKQIEPQYAIPMHYKIGGLKISLDGVEQFLEETGAAKAPAEDRLTIKKKDVLSEETKTQIVLLKPS